MRSYKIQATKYKILFMAIILMAAVLRVWGIGQYPDGLNADEAAIGYNAYSLLQSGKDEYGEWFPLAFKSFGDYKPGLYFYIVLPFVAMFGLNEFAVRLPSALLGVGTIILLYFLGKELFKSRLVALCSAFILAITPWHINFSRGSWETNAATFFITLGIFLFLKKIGHPWGVFWSLLSFLVAMYVYQSPRLVVPALFLGIFGLYFNDGVGRFKGLLVSWKKYALVFVVLLVLSIPLGLQFLVGGGSARFSGLSYFADSGPQNRVNELRGEHNNQSSIEAKVFHNKITAYATQFLRHYLDHFNGDFLFINGDPIIRNKVPETGQFYLISALFLILGSIGMLKLNSKNKWLVVIWLLVSPLASSMTYQTPNAVRALGMVVPLALMMGLGLAKMIEVVRSVKGRAVLISFLLFILGFETVHYLESYYIHYPKRYPLAWEYGFREVVGKLEAYEKNNSRIVMTDRYDQPYILVLFYKAALAQKKGEVFKVEDYQGKLILSERDKFNFGTVREFDNYLFREVKPEEIMQSKDTLFIVTPKEAPANANIVDRVKFPNGEDAFVFIKT